MMRSTFTALARSLRAGSVTIDELTFVVSPEQIQDVEYHKFRIRNAPRFDSKGKGEVWAGILEELNLRFDRVYVPGVIEWEK